jgi:tetratricopeptide (TPR) repeat protein
LDAPSASYTSLVVVAHEKRDRLAGILRGKNVGTPISASHTTATRRTLEKNPVDIGRAHTLLAAIAVTAGNTITAADHLSTALTLFEQYGRQRETAIASCNLGDLYLRQSEYALAETTLGRAPGIAKRIGMNATLAATYGNLGVLARRRGHLAEAEGWYRQGLDLALQINDPVYISLLRSYLASVLREQGRFGEASALLLRSLTLGRAMHNVPCLGVALVALGQLRMAQVAHEEHASSTGSTKRSQSLWRARATLQRALTFEEVEVETRTEGLVALAQVSLLLGDLESAYGQAIEALELAQQSEQRALIAQAKQVLGTIHLAQDRLELADTYFEQAMQDFRTHGMLLEWARTSHGYGQSLLQRMSAGEVSYQQGLGYLQEAYLVFRESNAVVDLQVVSRLLTRYSSTEQGDADMAQ